LAAFFLVTLFMPLAKRWAWKIRLVDMPTGRKAHARPMPLSGGIAMYIGVAAVTCFFAGWQPLVLVLVIGGVLLIAIGSVDDWFKAQRLEFPVPPRLIVQVLVAVIAYAAGIRFRGIGLSWFGGGAEEILLFPAWLSFLATMVWIVGFINMVNFLDGLDGLAGGVTTLSATALFFIALAKGQGLTALVAAALAGSTLAFLRFNFYPAQLFMGDAGATFLGFSLAIVSLEGAMKGATLISFVVTVLALGLPVIDTLQVMISRLLSGTPMYQADRRHMHHRLLSRGFTAKQTVFLLYLISLLFSAISLLIFLLIA
jgi:UDP-GlcNAc:undecaprenyl-phosphate GlcNAc-1-phosphate transferase